MRKIKVGIHGAAGYTGGELIRILMSHPRAELAQLSSSTFPGRPVTAAHPHLRGLTDLSFLDRVEPSGLDAVFLAGGHGEAMAQAPSLLAKAGRRLRLIDLSGDFRLKDATLYPAWYGREHAAPRLLKEFAYGLPELGRSEVAAARRVANPGCFATAVALALGPLAKAGWRGAARVTAVTGSSGSGTTASATTHHPTREGSLRAYKPLKHQHVPEVEQLLDRLAGEESLRVAMVPVSGPFVRGIYAVCHVDLPEGWTQEDLSRAFASTYKGCRFVRLLEQPPDLNAVVGSNFCDIHAVAGKSEAVVIAALDNLVKGASGQAVQNMNVMFGWDESLGLAFPGVYP